MSELPTPIDNLEEVLNSIIPAVEIIKTFEGLKCRAYVCPAGKWTIGYGHVIVVDGKMTNSDTHSFEQLPSHYQEITETQAEELLMQDIFPYTYQILKLINQPLNKNQLAALISFTYNCGPNALKVSSLRRYINSTETYDTQMIHSLFGRWKFANGKILNGLIRRRKAEAELFCMNN